MVDDLQTLAAADAASLHLQQRRTDLADVAANAADSLARRFEAADVTLHRQLSSAPVLGDPRWLHQVATNLLSNALKFTPAGGSVTIAARRNGPNAVTEVTDTGIGIPAGELPHILTGSGRGRAPRRPPAAASAWRSPRNWPGHTVAP
jgi:signal transduction histidine kinase